MPKLETLNEMTHLKESGFGQPYPRHGLKLLYWFATNCISFVEDNEMVSQCDPQDGAFGFHHFENRCDRNGDKLLPDVDFPYYMLGNLNCRGAYKLPNYIREGYTRAHDNRNKDRIIVSLDDEYFDKVYVTAHVNDSNFDVNSTYRISRNLLMMIRRQTYEDFLSKMGYHSVRKDRTPTRTAVTLSNSNLVLFSNQECRFEVEPAVSPQNLNQTKAQSNGSTRSSGFWDFCTII